MKHRFLASYWRDPDPLRRWAAGQAVRRWRSLPMAKSLIAMAVLAGLAGGALHYLTTIDYDFGGRNPVLRLAFLLLSGLVLTMLAVGAVGVAGAPVDRVNRLGGPMVLRDLSLTTLGAEQVGRMLYWGSWRGVAVPTLALLYFAGFLSLGFWVLICTMMGERVIPKAAWANPGLTALIVLVAVALPALDHAMNLAIAWRLRFRFRSAHLVRMLMWGVVGGSPALVVLLCVSLALSANAPHLAALASGLVAGLMAAWAFFEFYNRPGLAAFAPVGVLIALAAGFPALFSLLCWIGESRRQWPTGTWMDLEAGHVVISIVLLWSVKGRWAWASYRRFINEFEECLNKNFP